SGIHNRSSRFQDASAVKIVVAEKISIQPANKPMGTSTKIRSWTVRWEWLFKLPIARVSNRVVVTEVISANPKSWKGICNFVTAANNMALETYQDVLRLLTAEHREVAH